jgi:4'-phosphopantetheinyl transferase
MQPSLGESEIHVWWATPAFARDEHLSLLNPGETQRYADFRRQQDKDRFLTGCTLIRLAIGGYLGVPPGEVVVERGCDQCDRPHGKPAVPGGPQLSISHSGSQVVLAVTRRHPVGVDVEQGSLTASYRDLAASVLDPAERAYVDAVDEAALPAAFLRYWTRKEAVVKATGAGLRTALKSVVVSAPDAPAEVLAHPGGGDFHLFDLRQAAPGHLAALAVLGPAPAGKAWRVVESDATTLTAVVPQ